MFRVLVVVAVLSGIITASREVGATCNNQCRHRRDHCYNENADWRCWHWVTAASCYYCVGANELCEKRNDAFAGPCAPVTGQTNDYEIYNGCTITCSLNPGAKTEGTCSGMLVSR